VVLYTNPDTGSNMAELENKKFQYKKDRMDWIMIWIIIFTIACFAFLFYGFQYFQSPNGADVDSGRDDIEDLANNKAELERRLQEYVDSPNFEDQN